MGILFIIAIIALFVIFGNDTGGNNDFDPYEFEMDSYDDEQHWGDDN